YVGQEYLERIPLELLHHIFSFVPAKDLLVSCTRVCYFWRDAIESTAFWWDRIREECCPIRPEIITILRHHNNTSEILRYQQILCICRQHDRDFATMPQKIFKSLGNMANSDWWQVEDDQIPLASAMLTYKVPKKMTLIVRSHPDHLKHTSLYGKMLSSTNCTLLLDDRCSWRNGHSTDKLLSKFASTKQEPLLCNFRGNVTDLRSLPRSLSSVHLCLRDDQQTNDILADLAHFNQLMQLHIHIPCGTVSPACLSQGLPEVCNNWDMTEVYLYISHSSDQYIDWTIMAAKELMPMSGYRHIYFPSSDISTGGWRDMIQGMKAAQVRLWSLDMVPNTHFPQEAVNSLDKLASKLSLGGFKAYNSNEKICGW
ncbi:unnamed protein product, partial [Meganyctiphanes norvegica]